MTEYAKDILRTFQLEGVRFTLDEGSRRRLMAISAIPFLAVAAMVAYSWLAVVIGRPAIGLVSEPLLRGQSAAAVAASLLTPLSLAVLIGAGVLELTDGERMWALALAVGAALVALGFAVTSVVMALALDDFQAFEFHVNVWASLGRDLGLIAAGYAYCARPRPRRSMSSRRRAEAGGSNR